MARKQATFKSLLDYMHKECTKDSLSTKRNILSENREDIAREFEENARYLPKRKGGNYLYHEIITIPKQEKLSSLKQQKILIDLADKYLEKRAENLLSYGVIHTDTNNLHIHLLISANEPLSKKRYRLNKRKFAEIQKEIELYKLEKYPELETKKIYTKDIHKEKQKSISHREYEVIKRGGTSKKQEIINITRDIIFRSKDEKELNDSLEKIHFKIYTRGNTTGLENIKTKRRYRFKTLGLDEQYKKKLEEFDRYKERKKKLERERSTNRQVDRVLNLDKKQQR